MATARRGQTAPLIDLLSSEPYRFDSSQVLRVLEARRRALPGASSVAAMFRSSLSLTFPVSDIESVAFPVEPATPPTVTVSFIGLGGAMGPLPTPYTEYLNAGIRRGETAGRDFIDLFNHRLVVSAMDLAKLFNPALQPGKPQDSSLARQYDALLGLGTPGMKEAIPDLAPALLPLTALLHQRPASAHAIERAVAAHFQVPVRVIPFRGAWMRVSQSQRSSIGTLGRNHRLGVDTMLGGRLWDQSAGITLEIGPVSCDVAERFLPPPAGSETQRRLADLLGFMIEGEMEVAVRLLVERASLGSSRLSRTQPMRLGWTSWLKGGRPARSHPTRLGYTAWLGGGPASTAAEAVAPRYRLGGQAAPPIAVIALKPARALAHPREQP